MACYQRRRTSIININNWQLAKLLTLSKLQNCSFDGIFCESMVTHKKKDTIRATFP